VEATSEAGIEDAPGMKTDETPVLDQAEPAATQEPVVATATAEATVQEAPEQEVNSTAGVTEAGRAVNDPRVAPKPVTETSVSTEMRELFANLEAPSVTVVQQDVPRASNDPRGPRAA
jgi:ribonuclease E